MKNKNIKLSKIFSSVGRINILEAMVKHQELSITEIANIVKLSYIVTNEHCKILKKYRILKEKQHGRIRIFCFNIKNPKVWLIKSFIQVWNNIVIKNKKVKI